MVKLSKHSKSISLRIQSDNNKFKELHFWARNPINGKYLIDPAKLREFLILNGFAVLNHFGGSLIIKNTYNIVDFVCPQNIFNFCLAYVNNQENKALTSEFLVKGEQLLISKKALIGSLPELKLTNYKDTKSLSHYFYENAVVRVDSKGLKLLTYKQFKYKNQYIFKSTIIKRHFDSSSEKESQFEKFLKIVTNSEEHFWSVLSTMGFLLHKYKNQSVAKAVIISDILSQATNEPHGRSGKGLIIKALGKLTNTIEYNGKNLDLKSDKFAYQSIEPDTDLFIIQDVGKGFEFDDLFSVITDNLNVEKKYSKKIIIDFTDSPKIAITTNYTIPHNSDSYSDRKQLLFLNNHFNAHNKPEQIFKNQFFNEWSDEEYKAFDKFMMTALQTYLLHGLVNYDDPDLRRQNLIINTSEKFVKIMEADFKSNKEYYSLKELANQLDINSSEPFIRSKITKQWLQTYADFKNLKFEARVSGGFKKFILLKN